MKNTFNKIDKKIQTSNNNNQNNLENPNNEISTPVDLNKLALKYGTDKYGSHFYTPHYQNHFEKIRLHKLNILEIGVAEGTSLKIWKEYFPNSMIYGIDIEDKKFCEEDRIHIFQGSQDDPTFLKQVFNEIKSLDIIIDDGSHVSSHIITSFETLFPLMNLGGIYVVEDIQTSYWGHTWRNTYAEEYDKAPKLPKLLCNEYFPTDVINMGPSAINYFRNLVHHINYAEIPILNYQPTAMDTTLLSICFYQNMVFITKGLNEDGSNSVPKHPIKDINSILALGFL